MSEDTPPTERVSWGRRASDGVTVTTADMYQLLVKMDHTLTRLDSTVTQQGALLVDHENRIRAMEGDGLSERRMVDMEDDVKAIRADLEAMKVRVYAIPGASILIAAAAVVLTLVRTF